MIKKLSDAFGVSGCEKEVANLIKEELLKYTTDIKSDAMGNIFASKITDLKNPNVVLTAHMDECGFIITDITENGYLKFETIGKIPAENLISKKVKINGHIGIIALKAIHLTPKEEREKPIKIENLFIDIGAVSKAEAEKIIQIGDYAEFDSSFSNFGENLIKGKALDSRIGCNTLIDIFKNFDFDKINLICVFTVQKEISSRGALIASRNIKDAGKIIVVGGKEAKCGDGVIIGITDNPIFARITELAEKNKIKYQALQSLKDTEINAFSSQISQIPCIPLDVPCRYLKTPVNLSDKSDIEELYKLVFAILKEENNA